MKNRACRKRGMSLRAILNGRCFRLYCRTAWVPHTENFFQYKKSNGFPTSWKEFPLADHSFDRGRHGDG